jgi:hypothetical protein
MVNGEIGLRLPSTPSASTSTCAGQFLVKAPLVPVPAKFINGRRATARRLLNVNSSGNGTLMALPRLLGTKNGEGTMVTEMVFYVLTALSFAVVVLFAASLLIA